MEINMARPRLSNPKLSQNFRMPRDMHEKINAAAKEQGVSVTAILTIATEQWLASRNVAISLSPMKPAATKNPSQG